MQSRLLFVFAAAGALLAGCAEVDPSTDGTSEVSGGTPPASVTNEQAAALFAGAAGNMPPKFGMELNVMRSGVAIMEAKAAFDNTTGTSFFRMTLDESLTESMGSGASMMGVDPSALREVAVYSSSAGVAFVMGDTLVLSAPNNAMLDEAGGGAGGFDALSDPEGLIDGLREDGFTVKTVTPTTLRGKGALKIDATVMDEENGVQNVSVWLFQEPTRLARLETSLPAGEGEEGEPDPFAGATMQIDFFYDGAEIISIPSDIVRVLGLRYETSKAPFEFSESHEPEVWTFQTDGGLPLAEIRVEVGELDAAEPQWSMSLADATKTEGGVTLTFLDADADGKVSEGDTLRIEREDGAAVAIALRDTVTGIRVVPAAGLLLGLLVLAGVALLARRK